MTGGLQAWLRGVDRSEVVGRAPGRMYCVSCDGDRAILDYREQGRREGSGRIGTRFLVRCWTCLRETAYLVRPRL